MVGDLLGAGSLPRKVRVSPSCSATQASCVLHALDAAVGHLGQQDHGELAAQVDHARVGHVDGRLEQRCGQLSDQAGAVGPDGGDHELLHRSPPSACALASGTRPRCRQRACGVERSPRSGSRQSAQSCRSCGALERRPRLVGLEPVAADEPCGGCRPSRRARAGTSSAARVGALVQVIGLARVAHEACLGPVQCRRCGVPRSGPARPAARGRASAPRSARAWHWLVEAIHWSACSISRAASTKETGPESRLTA